MHYIKARQLAVVIAVLGLLSSLSAVSSPITLADVGASSGSAFLTVQIFAIDENDASSMNLQNDIFVAANDYTVSLPSVNVPAKEFSGPLSKRVIVTAYSSTYDQTDSTPFITAKGTYVRDGIIAANFLPFGTKVKFPEIYGDKIFTVEDRMALKNSHKMDIWMPFHDQAMEFGVQRLAYEIVE